MKYAVYLIISLFGLTIGKVVIEDGKYAATPATIVWITRHCELTIRSSDPDVPTESGSEDCTNEPEFEALRDNFKGQSSHLVGYADVQVTYASPVNGESQTEVLKVNARDPEFYYLREQDKIRIDVNKEKPTDIRFIDRPKV